MSTAGRPPPAAGPERPANKGRPQDTRLSLRRDPLRLALSGSVWRSAWFLGVYVFATGWLLCAVAFLAAGTAVLFAVTLAGIPLLTAAAGVLRGCANVERARLGNVLTESVRGRYQPVAGQGMLSRAKTRWRDGATWRDLTYLVGLWAPLAILDTVVLAVWLTFLAGITVPAWYWAPRGTGAIGYTTGTPVHGLAFGYFPHGPHGRGGEGIFVDTLPRALLVAAIFLVLFLLFNYVLVATARAHARVARAMLRAPADPLAQAKDVLARPGPLAPLAPSAAGRDNSGGSAGLT
jgi:hypothetical protein